MTRRYRFSAAHRLDNPALSAEQNRAVYGKCNNAYGHGHDYAFEISVAGEVDASTGRLLPPGVLDAIVRGEVLSCLDASNLNDLPDFAGAPPTTENLAGAIERRLAAKWPGTWPRVCRIRIEETRRNHFELRR